MSEFYEYPQNPAYGDGCYRRRIRLVSAPGRVDAQLEDTNHGLCVTVYHDDHRVTGLDAETKRIPFDTCPGATRPLEALTGLALSRDASELISQTRPQANCTHLFDLTILAICHAARCRDEGHGERIYDITLEDQRGDQPQACEIYLNGTRIHRWLTRDWVITAPENLAGKVLYKGFREWAAAAFSGDAAEAAFALQKGYFVGHARRYDLASLTGEEAILHKDVMQGACYTYSSPQIDVARRTANTVRDFSDTPEQLLTFAELS
jgi:hypothetical protein